MSQSYKAASDHTSLVSFVAPVASVLLSSLGASFLTESKVLVALGGGLGVFFWFAFLMLFVTPARMWQSARLETSSASSLRPRLVLEFVPVGGSIAIGSVFSKDRRTVSMSIRRLQLRNFGDVAAINARVTINIAPTSRVIAIRQPGPIDNAPVTVTPTLTISGVSKVSGGSYDEVASFAFAARTESQFASDLVIPFDVVCWDVDRRFEYRMPHVLTVPAEGKVRSELDTSRPEPEPTPLKIAPES